MANGTLDPEIIKQNVFLYASIIDTSIKLTKEPEKYEKKFKEFVKRDVTEKEKAESFLDLIMETNEDKKIYLNRWESVKDDKVYSKIVKKALQQLLSVKNLQRLQIELWEVKLEKLLTK